MTPTRRDQSTSDEKGHGSISTQATAARASINERRVGIPPSQLLDDR